MTLLGEVFGSHGGARLWRQLRGHRRIILFVTRLSNTNPSEKKKLPHARVRYPTTGGQSWRMILGEQVP
jgi:hypothetical protein